MKYIKLYEQYNDNFTKWFGNSKAIDSEGKPKVFYHGTNRKFDDFNWDKNRTWRNEQYQGNGFFFCGDDYTAWQYANASSNEAILKEKFYEIADNILPKEIAELCKAVIEIGYLPAWNKLKKKYGDEDFFKAISKWETDDKNINGLLDITEYVEGSNYDLGTNDTENDNFDLFGQSIQGLPEFIYDEAKEYGFEEALPNFNVKEVYLKMENPLTTDNKEEAKKALENGYDSVIYNGEGTINDTTEYIVYNPNQIKSIDNKGGWSINNPNINENLDI